MQRLDLGAHQRPVDEVIAQQLDPGVIAARLQVAVDEAPAESGISARLEIHRDERHFADRIDPAQLGIELDAVERRDAAVEQRDVAEMQVAVTFAHETIAAARVDLRRHCLLVQVPVLEPVKFGGQQLGR